MYFILVPDPRRPDEFTLVGRAYNHAGDPVGWYSEIEARACLKNCPSGQVGLKLPGEYMRILPAPSVN